MLSQQPSHFRALTGGTCSTERNRRIHHSGLTNTNSFLFTSSSSHYLDLSHYVPHDSISLGYDFSSTRNSHIFSIPTQNLTSYSLPSLSPSSKQHSLAREHDAFYILGVRPGHTCTGEELGSEPRASPTVFKSVQELIKLFLRCSQHRD